MFRLQSAAIVAAFLVAATTAEAKDTVIVGATVHVDAKTALRDASVHIRDGKIVAVGKVVAPAGATTIDGKGKVVTAGLVATGSRLGLIEVNAVGHTSEAEFDASHPIQAAYQVVDGYNPESIVIDVARNGGITSSISAPRGGLVSGQSAWMTLGEGAVDDNAVKASAALHINLGSGARGVGYGSRGRALQALRALFEDAQHYAKNRAAYDRGQTRKYGASHQDLQALGPALRGQLPVVAHANRKSDIQRALGLAKEFGLKLIISGGTESWLVADELAKAKVPVILNPKENLPRSFDHVHVVDDLATKLHAAGVPVIIAPSGDASSSRVLRQLAGLAVAHGLPWEEALASITTAPADAFGVDRGRLKKGAAADLVIWSGDPLEMSSHAEHIFIAGEEQSRENHQTRLLERYK